MKRTLAFIIALTMLVFVFASCGKDDESTGYGTHHVTMTFENYGTIEIELYGDIAPITVKNFVELVKKGYYNGVTISRVQQNFVIQGGKGAGTSSIKGEFLANGVQNLLSHKRGVISMARTKVYDSASDQFFISISDDCAASCDYLYAAFGIVTKGMDIIDKITEDVGALPTEAFSDPIMGFLKEEYQIKISSAKVID